MKVSILLATYNGEKYLREQIDSLLNQTYQDFIIYISDDNSSDSTLEIIKYYKDKFPNKFQILNHELSFGSAKGNFLFLLKNVDSDVFLFCDQDDVWTQDHVEILITEYKELSSEDKKLPILIHSDLTVVDSDLNIIASSFMHFAKIPNNPQNRFYYLSNNVTGCVSLVNNALKQIVFSNQESLNQNLENITMHDHFFALIAVLFGKKIYINKTTNLYRQHGKNEVGAGSGYSFLENMKKLFSVEKYRIALDKQKNMIKFFVEYFTNFDFPEKRHTYISRINNDKTFLVLELKI